MKKVDDNVIPVDFSPTTKEDVHRLCEATKIIASEYTESEAPLLFELLEFLERLEAAWPTQDQRNNDDGLNGT
jgi:hypothetical protein